MADEKIKISGFTSKTLSEIIGTWLIVLTETGVDNYNTTIDEFYDYVNGIKRLGRVNSGISSHVDLENSILLMVAVNVLDHGPGTIEIGTSYGDDSILEATPVDGKHTFTFNLEVFDSTAIYTTASGVDVDVTYIVKERIFL